MNYAQAKAEADTARDRSKAASVALQAFPKGVMGLTPDEVKRSPEYIRAKQEFDSAFANEQRANQLIARRFKAEAAAERKSNGR